MPEALDRLLRRAGRRPEETVAITADGARVSAEALVLRIAGLRPLLGDGRTVGVMAEDGPDWIVAALAMRAAGATLVPLPLFFSDDQIGHIVRDAGVSAIATSSSQAARAATLGRPLVPLDAYVADPIGLDDRGGRLISYTSGTTGRPKGAVIDAGALDTKAFTLAAACRAGPADRHLSILPLSLLLELVCAVHVVLLADAEVAFAPRGAGGWTPQGTGALLDAIAAAAPSVTVLVPALLAAWVEALETTGRRAPASLRLVAVGGAPVAAGLAQRAWDVGLPVHEGYGMTECCSVVALNRPDERRAGTVGRPLPGVAIMIEDGEIVVEDPSLMTGYLGGPPAPRRWHTGDLGAFDDAGRLVVTGRRDDMLVTSLGRNLSPGWPEGMALADPEIAHCVVIDGGNHPRAVVEPALRAASDAADVAATRWRPLPDYARPREVVVVAPGTFLRSGWLRADGSVDRKSLAAAFSPPTAATQPESPI